MWDMLEKGKCLGEPEGKNELNERGFLAYD